MVLVYTTYCTL